MKSRITKLSIILICILFSISSLFGQETSASGIITDASTGAPVPFATVIFVGSEIVTISDENGHFNISNTQGYVTLAVQLISYKTTIISLKPNKHNDDLKIKLETDGFRIDAVTIKPTRQSKKYSRKNNPAIELVQKVIEHKKDNRLESKDSYRSTVYEKLTLSLDKFDVDFDSSKLWKQFDFLKEYLDTSTFNSTPVLTGSIRENIYDFYYRKKPHDEKQVVHYRNMQGVDKILDREGLSANLDAMLQSVDIFSDNMEILLNSFVSPLSSSLATSYYKYFIMDTIEVSGDPCYDLAFVPMNSEGYGFTGHLYILSDGSFALKKYVLNIPANINLNFVSNLSITQEYDYTADGLLVPTQSDTYVNFYIFKKMRQVYAHQSKMVTAYTFDIPQAEYDSIFAIQGKTLIEDHATKHTKTEWANLRPTPLSKRESLIDSLVTELERIPKFRHLLKTGEVFVSGYIPTSKNRLRSKFDFGPIYSTISYNWLEGVRLRIGGMTTANLHPHWFLNGYVAFGCKDLRVKYMGSIIYSFTPKEYHAYESFRNALYITTSYDVNVPGQMYGVFDRDNILMSLNFGGPTTNLQYIARNQIKYEKEWPNRIKIQTWITHENNEAAGTLVYQRINADGSLNNIRKYNEMSVGMSFRFAPGEALFNNRMGKSSLFNLSNEAPVLQVAHELGYMQGGYWFNRSELLAQKRFWLSSFGHIDLTVNAGIEWNKVPFTKLFIPLANQSIFLQPTSFNMMLPMEFITDQYISLYASYYLKGWILNRIPLIKKLKFREVISFSALYGTLSAKNNPAISPTGLFVFPEAAGTLGKFPYMEMSVGIENILKFIRIDYVRRLNYMNNPKARRNGVRISLRFTL
ncbi:MAG: DUF5686 and carboxypeptidase regulatory-like domain-containing protein [Bacteroidales bacterium]|nr:DUF5686 and carboxypeptidase regulatory-like domain-containing protein [Bacteroidales bacterium]